MLFRKKQLPTSVIIITYNANYIRTCDDEDFEEVTEVDIAFGNVDITALADPAWYKNI